MTTLTQSSPARLLARPRLALAKLSLSSLVLALLLISRPGQAQDVSTYRLAASSGTFVPTTGGTIVNALATGYATMANAINLPFTLYYGGTA